MMGWLLFASLPKYPDARHATGSGAAAITKFCHKKLRMKTTAVELNPQVLAVCRSWFKLPPDSSTLQVVLADAAQEIKKTEWQGTVDALAVDLYDHEAAAPVLDSAEFYADCRNLLTEDGIMTVNLFGRSSSFDKAWTRWPRPLARTRSGPSAPHAKAIPWCWHSAHRVFCRALSWIWPVTRCRPAGT
jgi:spermidine synthase